MSKQPHTEFREGQRVIVIENGGAQYIGKYEGKFRNGITVDGHKFFTKAIRQVSIYKNSSPKPQSKSNNKEDV